MVVQSARDSSHISLKSTLQSLVEKDNVVRDKDGDIMAFIIALLDNN